MFEVHILLTLLLISGPWLPFDRIQWDGMMAGLHAFRRRMMWINEEENDEGEEEDIEDEEEDEELLEELEDEEDY